MKVLLTILPVCLALALSAQNIQADKWKNRLIIIIDHTKDEKKRHEQLAVLKRDLAGLKERKLKIYQFSPKGYQTGLDKGNNWLSISPDFNHKKFTNPVKPFTIYLIGLDGGIKMEKYKIVALPTIFALIDGMPMRRAELRGK